MAEARRQIQKEVKHASNNELRRAKAIMVVVAYTVSTKSNSGQANVILFLDAIKAWYLLFTLASIIKRKI